MNILLIFFALPIATIILSAVLEKVIQSPFAVASVAFAIYLIVTFAAFDATFLIAAIIYTLLALITALIVRFIMNLQEDENGTNSCGCSNNGSNSNTNNNSSNCGCGCRRR